VSNDFVFTSGSVTAGHPDKLCDQVSDAIVDQFLVHDPRSRIVAECAVASGIMFISAHYASSAVPEIAAIARNVMREAGYPKDVFDADACTVMTSFTDHGPSDVAGYDLDVMDDAALSRITPKHQVSVMGYACDQTDDLMPLPIWLSHRLAAALNSSKVRKVLPYLLPDGKAQVGIEYRAGRPTRIHGITLVASQTDAASADPSQLHADLVDQVIRPVLDTVECALDDRTLVSVNPEGQLIGGGPAAHSGLTGRKTGIDTYGEFARHSGIALSGKDPWRIDRVGAYAARYAAKNVVAAGLASECEVQLSYGIGTPGPVSIRARTFGTGNVDEDTLSRRLGEVFDFRLGAIVKNFRLQELPGESNRGFYRNMAVYGHMGRTDLKLPWEALERAEALK